MVMRFGLFRVVQIAILAFVLAGCTGLQHDSASLTPIPPLTPADPTDEALHAAVRGFFQKTGAPAYSRYQFARFDLNEDGLRDGIVYIEGPYGYWCGTEGCALLILQASRQDFKPVSLIRRVRNPIHVSKTQHQGWHDLAVRVAAGDEKAEYVLLRFDGSGYPTPPALAGQGVLFYPDMNLGRFFP